MKTFEEIYSNVERNCKEDLEKYRKVIDNREKIIIVIAVILCIISICFIELEDDKSSFSKYEEDQLTLGSFFYLSAIMVGFFGGYFLVAKPKKEFASLYKEKIIKRIYCGI